MLGLVIIGLTVWLAIALVLRQQRRGLRPPSMPRVPPAPVRPPRGPVRADAPHVLYQVNWRFTDRPIYFGISNDDDDRRGGHERRSWWWPLSDRTLTVIARFDSRPAALAAERGTIRRAALSGERLTNVQHNPNPVRREDVRNVRPITRPDGR